MKKIILILLMMILIISLSGCKKASSYTEQEHIRNISEIIEEKYLENNITYKLRPLYDYNDKLSYFVVDFSNNTYFYIQIREKDESLLWGPSLYIKDTAGVNSGPWQKSIIVEENGQLIEKFEKDSNGFDIYYYNSHFDVAKIPEETKCYLIELRYSEHNFVPAIKKGDNYLNLITMEEFNEYSSNDYPNTHIDFIPKVEFNL